ncbi:alpha/beta-hydrolase [Xylariaceae sp. FL0662B]|nr:alpha/beta-hydrolase [Xylariaceae sp. FL0662B]
MAMMPNKIHKTASGSTNQSSNSSGSELWREASPGNRPTSSNNTTTSVTANDGSDEAKMFFSSLNSLAPVSIVLLHTFLSSHQEWQHVWPKLSEYHLLIPDLPEHSGSRHLGPFSFALAADLVAAMIREHADGQAHIVGVSIGGFVAMELVRRHPDVVQSVFVSGAVPPSDGRKPPGPKFAFFGLAALLYSPNSFLLRATGRVPELGGERLLKDIKRNMTPRLTEAVVGEVGRWKQGDMEEVGRGDKRIALVAGGKHDNVQETLAYGRLLKSAGKGQAKQSRAFIVKDAIHDWNLQFPEVFARGVRAWIERFPLPPEFEPLE